VAERTKFQEKIIKSYYRNRDGIAEQRVQELITDLYLAEGKKRQQHWKNLRKHLEALGAKPPQLDHLEKQDRPELVLTFFQTLTKKS
jgi:hypothetical protein